MVGYQVGDVVKYGGMVYIAVENNQNVIPAAVSTQWDVLISGFEYKGTYSSGTTYKINDVVLYGGSSYIATAPGTGNSPSNTNYWSVFVEGFQYQGVWNVLTPYQTGDIVNYGGIVYVALQDSTGSTPVVGSDWAILTEGIAWKGAYSGSTQYNKNDIVSYGGSSWIAKDNTTGNSPVVGTHWDILAAGTFPSLSGQSGKFLSNNGSVVQWVSDVTVNTLTATSKAYVGNDGANFDLVDGLLTSSTGVFSTTSDVSSYAQLAMHNNEPTSSADFIAYPDNGWDGDGWIDMGVTGSQFSAATYGITGPNDGYIFMSAPMVLTATITNKALTSNIATLTTSTAHSFRAGTQVVISGVNSTFNGTYTILSTPTTTTFTYAKTATNVASSSATGTAVFNTTGNGNLVLATGANGAQNAIVFAAGGYESGRSQMTILPDQSVKVNISTASTSPTTGAFQVVGGVGVSGNLNVAGNVNIVGTIAFGGSGTTVSTANLAVDAPIVFSGTGNIGDAIDLGLVSEYTIATASPITKAVSNKALTANIATLTTTTAHGYSIGQVVVVSSVDSTFNGTYTIVGTPTTTTFTYKLEHADVPSAAVSPNGSVVTSRDRRYAGIARNYTDGVYKFFSGATTKPSTTINFSESGLVYAPVKTGAATVNSLTVAASGSITATASGVTSAIQNLTLSGSTNVFDSATISAASTTITGAPTFSGNPVFSGAPSFTGTPSFTGGIRVQEMIEDVVDASLSTNTMTLDYSTGNIFYLTSTPGAAMTIALTNAPTTDGRVFTINVFVAQGATGYVPTTMTINGSAASIKWAAGATPTPTSSAGKIDIFTYVIVRRSAAYTVLGSANLNF
jgi:hypothetical protein